MSVYNTQNMLIRNPIFLIKGTIYTEKYLPPSCFFIFAHLSHLNYSDHQTHINITQRQPDKYKMQFLNDDVIAA